MIIDQEVDTVNKVATNQGQKVAKANGDSPGYGNTVDYAYDVLKQRVFDGTLAPNQRLVETDLARELQISRTPIREAVQRLIVDGLVERSRARGIIVVELTAEEIEDLYVTRATLEGLAARLAAQRMSNHEYVTLQEIQEQMEIVLAAKDPLRLAHINFAFHTEILRIARNATTAKFMAQIHDALRRYGTTTLSLSDRATDAIAEHRKLLAALVDRDGDTAEQVARHHIEGALRARLRLLARRRLAGEEPNE